MTKTSSTKCGCPGAAATHYPSVCTHINAAEARDEETKEKDDDDVNVSNITSQ